MKILFVAGNIVSKYNVENELGLSIMYVTRHVLHFYGLKNTNIIELTPKIQNSKHNKSNETQPSVWRNLDDPIPYRSASKFNF